MVALNFFPQFVSEVETGKKRQTIRSKTTARVGCVLHLYTGLRRKGCRKLKNAICLSVEPITLMERVAQPHGNVTLMGMYLEEFAQRDGFATYADMWAFFAPRANADGEFNGVIIKW